MPKDNNKALANELLEVQRTLGWMDLVIGNITDAVYVLDQNSKIMFVNQYFADMVNVPRVFLLGTELNNIFDVRFKGDPNNEYLLDEDVQDSVDGSNTNIYEWQNGDQYKIFKISNRFIAPIKQTVFIAKDITTEYELSVMKTNFINIASHQLRTPMTAIMTYAHMLQDGYAGKIDDKKEKLVKSIVDSSERMIALINDILLISRVQNGEENLKGKDGTLIQVLNALENELATKLADKQLQFEKNYSNSVKNIQCNKFIIHEILSNLLTNAIQYTPQKGTIALDATVNGNEVIIMVSDSGIGIPKDYISEMYNQFSRAENAFEMFNEGTGLGLYIVKVMLNQIDGRITCSSEVGKGTTFTIAFPNK